jgi:hypothetical protein
MEEIKGYIDITLNGRVVPLTVQAEQVIKPELLARNIAINLARKVPRFTDTSGRSILRKDEKIAIVSGGHSLNDQFDELREFKHILVCGSAHDHLVRQGIIPTYATVCDGGREDKGNLSLPQKETIYVIASQCDPNLFDHLEDYNVEMFHYRGQTGRDLEEEAKLLNGEPSLGWGSTVTLISIHVALLMGFQHQHFFGFDNCYSEYGVAQHSYDVVGGFEYEKKPVYVGEKKRFFISNMGLATQVEQFFRLVEMWREWIHVTLHGDGLPHEMVRQGDPGLTKFVGLA